MNLIIEASGLRKRYGTVVALDGLDLSVEEGAILALLGPNGAGKTTAVSILTTLLRADEGSARVAGADVKTEPKAVRERIGLSGQYAAVDEQLTGFENLRMIGRLFGLGRKKTVRKSRELLDRFELSEAADRPVKTYSGGMRRRLDLACALVGEPPVLFLDEPTTGLDPRSRYALWEVMRGLSENGTTLLLTTQYMEEADHLAHDIVVIDQGKEIAHGNADELKRMIGGQRIAVTVSEHSGLGSAKRVLERFSVGEIQEDERSRTLVVPITGGTETLSDALKSLKADAVPLEDVGMRLPTLDDVFLTITGHGAESAVAETRKSKKGARK